MTVQKKKIVQADEPKRWSQGRAALIGASVVLLIGVIVIWRSMAGSQLPDTATRNFICSETGKPFAYTLKRGDRLPVLSPYTKRMTGYPAEKCYWTRDGKVKLEPTLVLLNTYINKPEPTICPDCGHEVKPHNPRPPAELFKEAIEARKRGK